MPSTVDLNSVLAMAYTDSAVELVLKLWNIC